MNMKTNQILFIPELSKKDKIKGLIIPNNVTHDLAYLVGVLAGDGSISIRPNKHDYRIKCVGDVKHEKAFYHEVINPIFNKLFNINLDLKLQDSNTTYGFYIYSKALVYFFNKNFQLPIGKKYSKLVIPKIIEKYGLIPYFLRGLADTDFGISIKKSKYICIVGSSKSKNFMKSISSELKKLGFTFYEVYDYKLIDKRFKKGYSLINRIEINGNKNFKLWMKLIGFSNPKHKNKIKISLNSNKSFLNLP